MEIAKTKGSVIANACVACKKRKGKCDGIPCSYCNKKGIACEFRENKRRGPISKKLRVDGGEEGEFLWTLSQVQEKMNALFQQCSFVDFYFSFVGVAIPQEHKLPLLSNQNSKEYTTQLCVVFAHIMRCFNNKDAENHYIAKARRYAANIFDSDTLESAIALIMMSIFEGHRTHKGGYYASVAHNILKLPSVQNNPAAQKLMWIANGHSIALDSSVSFTQRSMNLLASLPQVTDDLSSFPFAPHELAFISMTRQQAWSVVYLKLDWSDTTALLQNVKTPVILDPSDIDLILQDLNQLMNLLDTKGNEFPSASMPSVLRCHCDYVNFCVAWRTGNNQGAEIFADSLMAKFKANPTLPGIMLSTPGQVFLCLIPYFFESIGLLVKAEESLSILDICYTKLGSKPALEQAVKDVGIQTKLQTFTITQMEQVLLTSTNNLFPLPNEEELDQLLQNSNTPIELLDLLTQNTPL